MSGLEIIKQHPIPFGVFAILLVLYVWIQYAGKGGKDGKGGQGDKGPSGDDESGKDGAPTYNELTNKYNEERTKNATTGAWWQGAKRALYGLAIFHTATHVVMPALYKRWKTWREGKTGAESGSFGARTIGASESDGLAQGRDPVKAGENLRAIRDREADTMRERTLNVKQSRDRLENLIDNEVADRIQSNERVLAGSGAAPAGRVMDTAGPGASDDDPVSEQDGPYKADSPAYESSYDSPIDVIATAVDEGGLGFDV